MAAALSETLGCSNESQHKQQSLMMRIIALLFLFPIISFWIRQNHWKFSQLGIMGKQSFEKNLIMMKMSGASAVTTLKVKEPLRM